MTGWDERIAIQLQQIAESGQWRANRPFDAMGQIGELGGHDVVSFGGNDYLGLSEHPSVIAAAAGAAQRWGTGSTSARLLVGTRPVHEELERDLADWKGTEAALVFSTGYQANLGVLSTLGADDTTIFSDELNHASIIDGCRLSRARTVIYRHRDAAQVVDLLQGTPGPAIVVTDTVFSMDGDVAPVEELMAACATHGALLVVDEAHAALGPSIDAGTAPCPLLRVGTLSKSLGSMGGFVAGPRAAIDLLVNRARPFIFTTGLTPPDSAAARAALEVLRSREGDAIIGALRANVDRVRADHPSPIIPVIVGDPDDAVRMSAQLLDQGLWVPAVRPPTVPDGTSRLRVSLSAAHTPQMIERLCTALQAVVELP